VNDARGRSANDHFPGERCSVTTDDDQRGLPFPGNSIDLGDRATGGKQRLCLQAFGLQNLFLFHQMRLKKMGHTMGHRFQVRYANRVDKNGFLCAEGDQSFHAAENTFGRSRKVCGNEDGGEHDIPPDLNDRPLFGELTNAKTHCFLFLRYFSGQ
jgi:hypothetical protein